MAIIYQKDKRSCITYAYESVYRWDKEKKQKTTLKEQPLKREPKPSPTVRHQYYGATYLLNAISDELGVTSDLCRCFPDTYKQLLSIAYYLIL